MTSKCNECGAIPAGTGPDTCMYCNYVRSVSDTNQRLVCPGCGTVSQNQSLFAADAAVDETNIDMAPRIWMCHGCVSFWQIEGDRQPALTAPSPDLLRDIMADPMVRWAMQKIKEMNEAENEVRHFD